LCWCVIDTIIEFSCAICPQGTTATFGVLGFLANLKIEIQLGLPIKQQLNSFSGCQHHFNL